MKTYGLMCPAFCFTFISFHLYCKSATRVQQEWQNKLIDEFALEYTKTRTVKLEEIIHISLLIVVNISYYVVPILEQCKQIICWTKHRFQFCLNTHCVSTICLQYTEYYVHLDLFWNLGYGIDYDIWFYIRELRYFW